MDLKRKNDRTELKNTPILLTNQNLKKPIVIAKNKISKIKTQIETISYGETILQGLFVLLVSSFEFMLSDILGYYLKNFPNKLDKSEIIFTKDELLSNHSTRKLIAFQIEKNVNSLFYSKIEEVLEYFLRILSINNNNTAWSTYVDNLLEIKESRNLLLHNDLVVNSSYLQKAGPLKRSNRHGEKLEISNNYLSDSLLSMSNLITEIEKRIDNKYSNYTKIAALKNLWTYMFSSPIMEFENYWIIDEEEDRIKAIKRSNLEGNMASSERMFLGMWRAHFNLDTEYLDGFSMYGLDEDNKQKLLYFLSVIEDIRI